MTIRLSFKRMFFEPGKIFTVPLVAGARIRVVDGTIWATTSASPHDVWLSAGQEHTMEWRGLTVIESVTRASFELIPPAAAKTGGRITSRYDIAIPRTVCNLAAIAMTAITIGMFVVVPAKMAAGGTSGSPQLSEIVAMPPGDIVVSRNRPGRTLAQAQNSATPQTSVQ